MRVSGPSVRFGAYAIMLRTNCHCSPRRTCGRQSRNANPSTFARIHGASHRRWRCSGGVSPSRKGEDALATSAPRRWNEASRRRAAGTAAFPVSARAHAFYRRETLSGKAAILAAGKHLYSTGVKHCLGKPPSWRRRLAPVVTHSPIMVNRIVLRDNRLPASRCRAFKTAVSTIRRP